MAAFVKSQALEMLCGSTESSVQLAGGFMRQKGPRGNSIRPERKGEGGFGKAEGGFQISDLGLQKAEIP